MRDIYGVPLEPEDDVIVAYDWAGNEVYQDDQSRYFYIDDELIPEDEIADYINKYVSDALTPYDWKLCVGINWEDGVEVARDWRDEPIYSDEGSLYYQPVAGDFVYEDEIEEYAIACMSELGTPEEWGYTERIISR